MAEELSVWASDPVIVHTAWYLCWLEGLSGENEARGVIYFLHTHNHEQKTHTAREAVESDRGSSCEGFEESEIHHLLLREIAQQYNLFASLTPYLNSPPLLQGQTTYHLPHGMCSFLCEN